MNLSKFVPDFFDTFNQKKVLIVGDVMVDTYLSGSVDRISPEAPVPVVALQKRENRPGGAANVALNVLSMGAKPLLCTVIGDDGQGMIFTELLSGMGVPVDGIIKSKDRITTTKFRIIGNKMQMLRVDEECLEDLNEREEHQLLRQIQALIKTESPDVIILQDYDKGVLTEMIISEIISLAVDNKIPICVDPKKKHFYNYKNVSFFKPNLKELKEGLKTELSINDKDALEKAVIHFQTRQNIGIIMVTLSEHGVMIHDQANSGPAIFIPAHTRAITDVSGAGDTVISLAALCLSMNCKPEEIAMISNLAGGLVCEQAGVAPVDKERLLNEIIKLKSI